MSTEWLRKQTRRRRRRRRRWPLCGKMVVVLTITLVVVLSVGTTFEKCSAATYQSAALNNVKRATTHSLHKPSRAIHENSAQRHPPPRPDYRGGQHRHWTKPKSSTSTSPSFSSLHQATSSTGAGHQRSVSPPPPGTTFQLEPHGNARTCYLPDADASSIGLSGVAGPFLSLGSPVGALGGCQVFAGASEGPGVPALLLHIPPAANPVGMVDRWAVFGSLARPPRLLGSAPHEQVLETTAESNGTQWRYAPYHLLHWAAISKTKNDKAYDLNVLILFEHTAYMYILPAHA